MMKPCRSVDGRFCGASTASLAGFVCLLLLRDARTITTTTTCCASAFVPSTSTARRRLLLTRKRTSWDYLDTVVSSAKFATRRGSRIYQHPSSSSGEDLFAAVHRKEHEMKQVRAQHTSTTDPVRMAMGYASESVSPMRLAKALRRVYEDKQNPANPDHVPRTKEENARSQQLADIGMADLGMRRASFIVDIKRKSPSGGKGGVYCNFDDAGMVAEAMVRLGADAVFINTDYAGYGGDMSELKSAVRAVRKVSKSAAVVMKDIVVDEIQLGLAKEAGADGILLIAAVLGSALENFVNLATVIGLETIVECHTRNEVTHAMELLAPTILINNRDRLVGGELYPDQAIKLGGMFPGTGGPIISLAGGGIDTVESMKRHLTAGYDGVVVGKAVMGSPSAPEFIRAARDRTLLPAEMAQWGIDAEFDADGNLIEEGSSEQAPPRTDKFPSTTNAGDPSSSFQ